MHTLVKTVLSLVRRVFGSHRLFAQPEPQPAPVLKPSAADSLPERVPYGYGVDEKLLREIEFWDSANFEPVGQRRQARPRPSQPPTSTHVQH